MPSIGMTLVQMLIEDPVLPAAAHLSGRAARDVLAAALRAAGGELNGFCPCHVQYRPGHDVVVRFDATVSWSGRPPVDETLLAATTVHGAPPATLPVEAVTAAGDRLTVGVWRWPFDPRVTGLPDAVTPSTAAQILGGIATGPMRLEVVAYRPTQRAVVRATDATGVVHYLKAVAPARAAALVERHRVLSAAGVPVPRITHCDADAGVVAMVAMDGPTVRERLHTGDRPWPPGEQYERILRLLASAEVPGAEPLPSRVRVASSHAAMLAAVVPSERERLDRLTDQLAGTAERAGARHRPTIHGDLYDAQLVTAIGPEGGSRITGVLDIDDVGPGDPLDDRATTLAHLLVRTLDRDVDASDRRAVAAYAAHLRRAFGTSCDPVDLDLVTAGALVGLATGPFRVQQRGWRHEVRRRIGLAERLVRHAGEESLSVAS
jgi:aminoglycoside phosphotransferase (APT) family kinase protein